MNRKRNKCAYLLLAAPLLLFSASLSAQNVSPKQDTKKGTWGYVFSTGKWAVKPKYESALPFEKFPDGSNVSKVTIKGLSGYVDENGKPLGAGIVFESMERLSDKAVLVKTKGKYGIVNNSMVYIIKPEILEVRNVDESRMLVNPKGKYGLIDRNGNYLINPVYTSIDLSLPNNIRVMDGKKCGLMTSDYKLIIEPKDYTAIEPFFDYWKVYNNQKVGLYSTKDRMFFTKVDYKDVNLPINISGQYYTPVRKSNDKWGAVDAHGKELLKSRYSDISAIPELNLFFLTRPKFGNRLWFPKENVFLDIDVQSEKFNGPFKIITGEIDYPTTQAPARIYDKLRLDEVFDWESTFPARRKLYNSLFPDGSFNAILDKDGKLVTSCSNADIHKEGKYYFVKVDSNRKDLYNQEGTLVKDNVKGEYENKNGWLFFKESGQAIAPDYAVYPVISVNDITTIKLPDDGKWHIWNDGIIDSAGYQKLEKDKTFIHALRDGKWGIINNGKETVKCQFPEKLKYDDDLKNFVISENGLIGLMDINGNVIVKPEYDKLSLFDNIDGIVLATKNNKCGLLSSTGNVIFPTEYDSFKYTGIKNHMWVQKDGIYGVYADDGTKIFDIKYKDEDISVDDKYYVTHNGGGTKYHYSDGSRMDMTKKVIFTSVTMDHNVYVNGNKSLRANFDFETQFLKDEPLYVELLIFNANGTPAKKSNGQQIKWGSWNTPTYLFSTFSDRWISIPYDNFIQSRGTKRDYYAIVRIKDGNGKVYATSNKITFYMTK